MLTVSSKPDTAAYQDTLRRLRSSTKGSKPFVYNKRSTQRQMQGSYTSVVSKFLDFSMTFHRGFGLFP